jgi:hypothetical protein
MTSSIPHSLTALEDAFADLPKDDLSAFDDSALERVENLAHDLITLREKALEHRHIRPKLTIAGPVHPEVLRDAVRQGDRERN